MDPSAGPIPSVSDLMQLSQTLEESQSQYIHHAQQTPLPQHQHPPPQPSLALDPLVAEIRRKAFDKLLEVNFSILELQAIGAEHIANDLFAHSRQKMGFTEPRPQPKQVLQSHKKRRTHRKHRSSRSHSGSRSRSRSRSPRSRSRSGRAPYSYRRSSFEEPRDSNGPPMHPDRQRRLMTTPKTDDERRRTHTPPQAQVRYCKEYTLFEHCQYKSCGYRHYTTPEEKKIAEESLHRIQQRYQVQHARQHHHRNSATTSKKSCANQGCPNEVIDHDEFFCHSCQNKQQPSEEQHHTKKTF